MKIKKEIKEIQKNSQNLSAILEDASFLLDSGETLNANKKFIEAEKISENIVNQTRLLPTAVGLKNRYTQNKITENIIKENKIQIEYLTKDIFYVKIPALLPKKNGGNPIFIRSTLQVALDRYFSKNEKIILDKPSTIIFKHNYNVARPEREFRDHDNIEVNVVVDLLALYILIDDSPFRLRHFYLSASADEDSTEVFIVPNKKMGGFFKNLG